MDYYYNEPLKSVLQRPGFLSNPKIRDSILQEFYILSKDPYELFYNFGLKPRGTTGLGYRGCSSSGGSGTTGPTGCTRSLGSTGPTGTTGCTGINRL